MKVYRSIYQDNWLNYKKQFQILKSHLHYDTDIPTLNRIEYDFFSDFNTTLNLYRTVLGPQVRSDNGPI